MCRELSDCQHSFCPNMRIHVSICFSGRCESNNSNDICFTESCGSPKRGLSFEAKETNTSQTLNLDFMEEEKPLLPGVTVRAATVCKLANMAVQCFGEYSSNFMHVKVVIIIESR